MSNTHPPQESGQTVEKIRQLLFGGEMAQYERRFNQLEKSLQETQEKMQKELLTTIQNAKLSFENETKDLRQSLAGEADKSQQQMQGIMSKLQEAFSGLDGAKQKIQKETREAQNSLRDKLTEQSRFVYKELQDSVSNLTSYIKVEASELQDKKLDKAELAKALIELFSNKEPSNNNQPTPEKEGNI